MLCYLVQVVSPFITSFRYLFAFLPLPFRLLLYVLLRKKGRIPCSIHPACLSFTTSSILPLSIHTRRCISRPVKKSLALLSKKIFVHSGVFERKKFRERHRCTKRHLEASKVDATPKKLLEEKNAIICPYPFSSNEITCDWMIHPPDRHIWPSFRLEPIPIFTWCRSHKLFRIIPPQIWQLSICNISAAPDNLKSHTLWITCTNIEKHKSPHFHTKDMSLSLLTSSSAILYKLFVVC